MNSKAHVMTPQTAPVLGSERRAPVYWPAVTDVSCPVCKNGTVRWAEAGNVPGYRLCDACGQRFIAKGNAEQPLLIEC